MAIISDDAVRIWIIATLGGCLLSRRAEGLLSLSPEPSIHSSEPFLLQLPLSGELSV